MCHFRWLKTSDTLPSIRRMQFFFEKWIMWVNFPAIFVWEEVVFCNGLWGLAFHPIGCKLSYSFVKPCSFVVFEGSIRIFFWIIRRKNSWSLIFETESDLFLSTVAQFPGRLNHFLKNWVSCYLLKRRCNLILLLFKILRRNAIGIDGSFPID